MTKEELWLLVRQLNTAFEIVRLVDVSLTRQFFLDEEGAFVESPYHCYKVWGKDGRCENCISARVFAIKGKLTKLEFDGEDIYYVIARYVEVDDMPYVMEMVSQVMDDSLFGAYDKGQFMNTITEYNRKLYTDPLTGAYNRHYFEEQLQGLEGPCAVAMLDADEFKSINDTYGHKIGDLTLKTMIQTVLANMDDGNGEAVVRYGGDEFLLLFPGSSMERFTEKLETIRNAVEQVRITDYPDIRITVSIGGICRTDGEEDPIREADLMLYKAKVKRNDVQIR